MAQSPTSRSLKLLRDDGWLAQVVERRVPFRNTTIDLFGCIDIIAVKPGYPVLGIQATSRSNVSARLKKSIVLYSLETWLETGCAFKVWGWGKAAVMGKGTRKLWTVREEAITLKDIQRYKEEHKTDDATTLQDV